jgi:small subunit ribosomal protein S15Ae
MVIILVSCYGSVHGFAVLPCTLMTLSLQFGYIVLTTSAGIMDHEEARRKNVGGKVLGFFY